MKIKFTIDVTLSNDCGTQLTGQLSGNSFEGVSEAVKRLSDKYYELLNEECAIKQCNKSVYEKG